MKLRSILKKSGVLDWTGNCKEAKRSKVELVLKTVTLLHLQVGVQNSAWSQGRGRKQLQSVCQGEVPSPSPNFRCLEREIDTKVAPRNVKPQPRGPLDKGIIPREQNLGSFPSSSTRAEADHSILWPPYIGGTKSGLDAAADRYVYLLC